MKGSAVKQYEGSSLRTFRAAPRPAPRTEPQPAPRNRPAPTASAVRCLTVWAVLTVAAASGTALGVGAMAATLHTPLALTSIDQVLVTGAGIGAALLCPWLWVVATASVADALRGRLPARAGWTRRLTLLACGVAVTTSVVSPSQAASGSLEPAGAAETSSLSGLPYPDRPLSRQHGSARQNDPPLQVSTSAAAAPDRTSRSSSPSTSGSTHRVREGDTLWAIAAASTTGADLPRAVVELHQRNRRVIGADPDLIRPGQVLDLHSEGDESR